MNLNETKRSLIGRKITNVRYMTSAEAEDMGWYSRPVVIELDDGMALVPQSDDEGNDGGALWVADMKPGQKREALLGVER